MTARGIGIYGGTFDPVHYGHLRSALELKEIFALQQVRLIPCSQPPHRDSPQTTSHMRLQMLKLAIQNHSELIIDRRELNRKGYSYMIDTLKSIRSEVADDPLFLFMGSDAFKGLTTWHQWQCLFDYAHIVIITRPGYKQQKLSDFFSSRLTKTQRKLKGEHSGYLFFQSVTQLEISATAIRNIIETGLNPQFLLPDNVIEYITQKQLYKNH